MFLLPFVSLLLPGVGFRFFATFETEVLYQQKTLSNISEVSQILREVQRSWTFLENLFIYSEEVKKELPEQAARFVEIDRSVKEILLIGKENPIVKVFCSQDGILQRLESAEKELSICEKALNEFMDSKRMTFPRFYFVSSVDLLDILSNGNSPAKVMPHMSKVFQAIQTFQLDEGNAAGGEDAETRGSGRRPHAIGMESCVGKETVRFPASLHLTGKVKMKRYEYRFLSLSPALFPFFPSFFCPPFLFLLLVCTVPCIVVGS